MVTAARFYALQVRHVEYATRDALAITFDVPENLQETFAYVQGQYLTLRVTIEGQEVRRAYSICSAVQDQRLRVAVKRVSGGLFSNWAFDSLKPGQTVEVMPPQGKFYLPLQPDARRHVVAFASGSGITPVLSIVKSTLLAEPETRVTLVYGNRASSAVMFKEEIEDLKDLYLGRFNLVWIMSRESQDIPLFNGRIDYDKCTELLTRWIIPTEIDAAFICGPEDMTQAARRALLDRGVDDTRIKFELFGNTARTTLARPARVAEAMDRCEVEVVLDGTRRSFVMNRNDDNLVDAAHKAGLEMPYSCKAGVCSTCRAKVVEGEVDMDANFALEDYEVARGFVLCCQSYPVSERLVIDFDQEHAHN